MNRKMVSNINRLTTHPSSVRPAVKSVHELKQEQQNFQQLLQQQTTQKLHVSHHAQKRLLARDLHLEQADYQQLDAAMTELAEKGSRESLLVYKEMGLIANIQNRTIITAMDMEELHTITNIDSAKFIK